MHQQLFISEDSPWGLANELVEYGFINDVSTYVNIYSKQSFSK